MAEMPKGECKVCSRRSSELTQGMCDECRARHGLLPPAPALRPRAPCVRCSGGAFVRAQLRERAAAGWQTVSPYVAPLAATFLETDLRVGAVKVHAMPDLEKPVGVFEAYICRHCGLTELYVRDPASIPIGPEFGTELIEADTGPYR
jgi:hypothetical protein